MPIGDSLADYLDPIILALEDAVQESRLRHRVRIEASHVCGLPTGRPEDVLAAYHDLVGRGCVLILSTGVTNNALVLRDTINTSQVPYITMAGPPGLPGGTASPSPTGATARRPPSWPRTSPSGVIAG